MELARHDTYFPSDKKRPEVWGLEGITPVNDVWPKECCIEALKGRGFTKEEAEEYLNLIKNEVMKSRRQAVKFIAGLKGRK